MVTDYYRNIYQSKISHHGDNLGNKAISRGIDEFRRYLATTPTKQTLLRLLPSKFEDGDYIHAAIVGPAQQNVVADRYEKLILGDVQDNWAVGNLFKWHEEHWIIISQEKLTIPTHFKGKVRFCNHYLKWNIGSHIYQIPGHVITSRAFALEEGQKAGLTWDEQAMVIQAILPSTEITRTIKRYHRFLIKDKAWRVVSTDELSVENLLFIRLEEDQINKATDDLENGIADKYTPDAITEDIIGEHEYSINGSVKLYWNGSSQYSANLDGELDDDVSFEILDTTLATIVGSAEDNPVTIKANNQGITGDVLLRCTFSDNHVLEKSIRIVSLWGE